jgi:Flp pilus assembly protein TadG
VRRGQRGQTIVVSALAFVLLIAAVGLAIDFGGATNVKRNDQNAADAAALAGAICVADPPFCGMR